MRLPVCLQIACNAEFKKAFFCMAAGIWLGKAEAVLIGEALCRVSGPMQYPGNPHEGVAGLPDKRDPSSNPAAPGHTDMLINGDVPVNLAAATNVTCAAAACPADSSPYRCCLCFCSCECMQACAREWQSPTEIVAAVSTLPPCGSLA